MQYKASFIMTTIGQFLVSFTTFIGVYFMFSRFNTVDGFTFSEVLLCFSVVLMAFSLTECFVRGFDVFPRLIKSGDLDRILVRPRNEIFQVLTSNIDFSRFGRLFQAVLMLCYAIPTSGIAWNLSKVMTLIIMLVGGIAVFSALFVLYAGISFFTIEGLEFMNIFTDGSREFGKYPLSIYGEGVLRFLTYVVPIALFQYYPLLYLIGRSNNVGLIFLPFVGFLFLIPCYIFFKFGVRKYKSTGS
jgi:ABC-2 type transport system permease protein